MAHVSPHGMPSGRSRGRGGDRLGSVLWMIVILGGGVVGMIFVVGCCQGDRDRRASPPPASSPSSPALGSAAPSPSLPAPLAPTTTVTAVLAQGRTFPDSLVTVRGRVSHPFMTWNCPPGAICKTRPPEAPVMIIADVDASAKDELWVIKCPEQSTGFAPDVGMLVVVRGVVRADPRGGQIKLEHRETIFVAADGSALGPPWTTR
ncbi:MAG TPA: hypothetical protein VF516_30385 [Kofleriaceae bacterium]